MDADGAGYLLLAFISFHLMLLDLMDVCVCALAYNSKVRSEFWILAYLFCFNGLRTKLRHVWTRRSDSTLFPCAFSGFRGPANLLEAKLLC